MASNTDPKTNTIYRWIEKKPLTEAVKWTSRENFWLMTAACNYGTNDWKSVSQVVQNSGEAYRPNEWYTPKTCERQFKIIMSNASKELKSMSFVDMMQHVATNLQKDYVRDAIKSKDILKAKYCKLFHTMNRVKQGNLSRQEVVNLYSQARRFENDGKQYVDQLMMRQKASLASENSSSGLSEEPIKWNTPSAPLLTSLLRSRNTIPANRTVTSITSLLQSPGATSRTRSGKLLPLSPSVKTTQGTPTLSKLLEAPANPYIPKSPQSIQKNKQNEVITDKLVGNSKRENSQSTLLNSVEADNITIPGSLSPMNKSELSSSKKVSPVKSPVTAVKNGCNANLNIVNLLSDSENDEDGKSPVKNIQPKTVFGEKKDITSNRVETRATRSQTRAEENFKQLNDSKRSNEKKDQETSQQQSEKSQLTDNNSVDDELIDIDQIEVEPLSSVQDAILNQISNTSARTTVQRPHPLDISLTTKVNTKKICNQMVEGISAANCVINPPVTNVTTVYKNVVGQSQFGNIDSDVSCHAIKPITTTKDIVLVSSEIKPKPIKQKVYEFKTINVVERIDDKNNKSLSFPNNSIVLLNKAGGLLSINVSGLQKDNTQIANNDAKKMTNLNNSSPNIVQLLNSNPSFSDDVIVIDDDANTNVDDSTVTKTNELASNAVQKNVSSIVTDVNNCNTLSTNSKSTNVQLDEKKINDKTPWNMFGKTQNILNVALKKTSNPHTISKTGNNSIIKEDTNNPFIKELEFDLDQSISQTSLTDLYNGVEEIVEMHSFDNEELNSLIECGTLGNDAEVRQNPVSLDQGDSSVNECDPTIGAFDTFAQITGVPQKVSPKVVKPTNKDCAAVKEGSEDIEPVDGSIQPIEIDDDQNSVVSVTGIPVLQGVISDVMSKIDSDRVAALNVLDSQKTQIDDIVEISSDDDVEIIDNVDVSHDKLFTKSCKNYTKAQLNADLVKVNPETANETINILKQIEKSISNRNKSTVNKFDMSGLRNFQVVHKPGAFRKTPEMVNTQSKDEIELEINKNIGLELKIIRDNESKLLSLNKMRSENKLKESEIKNRRQIELKKIEEERLLKETDESSKKENEEKKKKVGEEKRIHEIKFKKVEKNEFETEIIKRFREIDTKIEIDKELKNNEVKKAKDAEMKKIKETETKKFREAEIQKTKEAELLKIVKENEARRVKEAQELKILKAKEVELQQQKEAELQRAKEVEIQRAKEVEMQKVKEVEMQKAKEIEIQNAKIAEIQKVEEAKIQIAKEAEMQKVKEAEAQKAKEEVMRITKEAELKKIVEAELKKIKEAELKKIKEAEIMKTKEDEARKTKEIEQKNNLEIETNGKEKIIRIKEAELKKIDDTEIKETEKIKKAASEMEILKLIEDTKIKLNNIVIPKENIISKKSKRICNERSLMVETNKINVNEIKKKEFEAERSKSNVQDFKKVDVNEEKNVNETEFKIFTRTRGLKLEEKYKDRNITSHYVLINSDPSLMTMEQSSTSASLTNEEIPSTSNHDSKKENKFLDNVKRCKILDTNLKVASDKHTADSNGSSTECIKTDNGQLVRTRSSSIYKQCKQLEINLRPYYCEDLDTGVEIKPPEIKSRISSLTSIPVSTNSNFQCSSETPKMESPAKTMFDTKCGKQLTVSVVMLSANEVTSHKEKSDQRSDDNSTKHLEKNDDEIVSPIKVRKIKKAVKPGPRRRGRKRRFGGRNDQTQQSKRKKPTLQNGSKIVLSKLSFNETEPPAKRTRRSIEINESKNLLKEKLEDLVCKKDVLKQVFENICDTNKYLSTLERQVKDLSLEHLSILKSPVELRDIKKKISSGEIKRIGELQVNLLMLSYNAVMLNRSDTIVFSDAANFQNELRDNCLIHQQAVNSNFVYYGCPEDFQSCSTNQEIIEIITNTDVNEPEDDIPIIIINSDSDEFNDNDDDDNGPHDKNDATTGVISAAAAAAAVPAAAVAAHALTAPAAAPAAAFATPIVPKSVFVSEILKCVESSSDESSDNDAHKKKKGKKRTVSDNLSDSGEDSDKLDYSWIY